MCFLMIRNLSVLVFAATAMVVTDQRAGQAKEAGVADVPCLKRGASAICDFPKTIVDVCAALPATSVFAQCNIFALSIGTANTKQDDNGRSYESAIFKYAERNNCLTGGNESMLVFDRCDTFAAYVQVLREVSSNKCYALVNSALLGIQREEDTFRNKPNKVVQKLEIPGVSRRITFTPSTGGPFLGQANSILIRTADSQRPFIRSGPAISALSVLELESALTVKPENLKPNPAKIRLTRGIGSSSDFLDFSLGRREEVALNSVLSGCQ
ncbi:MAG: hypothetical protein ACK59A_13870 [Cyanobacteriota bacterium]